MRARFVKGTPDLAGRPLPRLPEFGFVGRSNCGKSSLINHFLEQPGLAHTSRQPGKTRLLNYYLVDERFYLVDLPGYGYARVSQAQRGAWEKLIRAFLAATDRPLAVFHLLDARHEPSAEDRQMSRWLQDSGRVFGVAVTKIDKVGSTRLPAHFRRIIETLELPPETPFFPTSAARREGRREMRAWIDALLAAGMAAPAQGGRAGSGPVDIPVDRRL